MKLEQPEQIFLIYPDHSSLVLDKTFKGRHWKVKRFCYACGSETTNIKKAGDGHLYNHWFPNHDSENSALCEKCHFRLIDYPRRKDYFKNIANPKTHAKWAPRIFQYKDKRMYADSEVRTGVCSRCGRAVESGEIKRTNLHHEEYDDNKPLSHTVELCIACHLFLHNRGKDPLSNEQ